MHNLSPSLPVAARAVLKLIAAGPALLCCIAASAGESVASFRQRIDLNGQWHFALDPDSLGERERWFTNDETLTRTATVPGCWDAQGLGVPGMITTVANADDTLRNIRTRTAYNGAAWYARTFKLPQLPTTGGTWLHCGGVNDRCRVWVNGNFVGAHDGYSTPFDMDITTATVAGSNRIAIEVNNAPRPEGNLEGCLDFFTNWGGIYGDVAVEVRPEIFLDHVHARPRQDGSVEFRAYIRCRGAQAVTPGDAVELIVHEPDRREVAQNLAKVTGTASTMEIPAEPAATLRMHVTGYKSWSPADPHLYSFDVTLLRNGHATDTFRGRFGFRFLEVEGTTFLMNGKQCFLRGHGDDCIFPATIAPPTDKEFYRHEIGRSRAYGFNFARCHTWTPPAAYFHAADELGFLVQAELATGLHPFTNPPPALQKLWERELRRIIYHRFNHPSLAFFCMSNELGDELEKSQVRAPFDRLVAIARPAFPSQIVTITSAMGRGAETEPFYDRGIYLVNPTEHAHVEKVAGYVRGHDKPFVWHELGYPCSYPDPSLLTKYKGEVIPWWIIQARDNASTIGLDADLPQIVRNSQLAQGVCRKWYFELARRGEELDGFHWWLFKDTTWPVEGIVDDFCDTKPGAPPGEVLQYNGEVVVLLAQEPVTWPAGQEASLEVLVSSHATSDSKIASASVAVRAGDTELWSRTFKPEVTTSFGLTRVVSTALRVPAVERPVQASVHVNVEDARGKTWSNQWRVWIFPPAPQEWKSEVVLFDPDAVLESLKIETITTQALASAPVAKPLIATRLTTGVLQLVHRGGRALILSSAARGGWPERPAFRNGDHYPMWFATTFWGATFATGGGNWGTLIKDPNHLLGDFPQDGWCDLQFYSLLRNVGRFDLNQIRPRLNPVIRSLLDWRTTDEAAYLFHAGLGKGELVATTFNFPEALAAGAPEAQYLLSQLANFLLSNHAAPAQRLSSALSDQRD